MTTLCRKFECRCNWIKRTEELRRCGKFTWHHKTDDCEFKLRKLPLCHLGLHHSLFCNSGQEAGGAVQAACVKYEKIFGSQFKAKDQDNTKSCYICKRLK